MSHLLNVSSKCSISNVHWLVGNRFQ
jgi:hypothetical protein